METDEIVISGKINDSDNYVGVKLDKLVGKTVVAVTRKTVPSNYDDEECIMIYFDDNTCVGFVVPSEE